MTIIRLPLRTLLGAVGLAAASLATAADSFTVGVLSCAAETDRDRRLECYDRAVAGYTAALAGAKRDAVAGSAPLPATAPAASVPPPATALAGSATGPANAAPAIAGSALAVAAADAEKPAGPAGTTTPRHVAARISSIEHFPDYIVVHLDNQQTWKQVSDSPGSLVLRNGDPVTVDRQMGSFWLAGPKGEAIQVRLEASRP
jgi:hypothetical protein